MTAINKRRTAHIQSAWLSILLLLLGLSYGTTVHAQEPGPTLQVDAGFSGLCQDDAWCPVRVIVTNEGADVSGELQLQVRPSSIANVSRYYQTVTLPANARKAYVFYLPPETRVYASYPRIQLVADNRTLASAGIPVQQIIAEDHLYVTVGDPTGALSFLGALEPMGRGQAHVVDVALTDLPDDPLAWESIDVLILQEVDTTALSDAQQQALQTWLQHGGRLVIGGGPGAATTLTGLGDLAPVRVTGSTSVPQLDGLQRTVDASVADGPFAIAVTALRDDGVLVLSQPVDDENLLLVARREIGQGEVTFLAFAPALNPFQSETARIDFWRRLLGNDLGLVARPRFETGYNLERALSIIPGISAPPVLLILGFLVTYTLLVGPVNYLALRQTDRRTWAWLTVPALALIFSGLAYVSGSQLRGNEPILHRLLIAYVPAGADQGRAIQTVGLFSPQRRRYTLQSENPRVTTLDLSGMQEAQDALTVQQTSSGVRIEDARFDVGELSAFGMDSYIRAPDLTTDFDFNVDPAGDVQVTGAVRTGDTPVEGLVLLIGAHIEPLGDLDANAVKQFNLQLTAGALIPSPGKMPVPDQIFQNAWTNPVGQLRYNLLSSTFVNTSYGNWNGPDFGTGVYLMAWQTTNLPEAITLTNDELTEHTTALYVYALPVNVPARTPTGEILVPPSLFNWDHETLTGQVNLTPQGFFFQSQNAASAVSITFTPIPDVRIQQPRSLTIQLIPEGGTTPQYAPQIALWSYETASWEPLNAGWGETVVNDPASYVAETGEVRCRLTVDPAAAPLMVPLPALTLRGR